MSDYQTKYDVFYGEALCLFNKRESIDDVFSYIDSLQGEDYRDHTLMKMARHFASIGRLADALRFCDAIVDQLERADALFGVGRELRTNNFLDSARDVFRQTIEVAVAIESKPSTWEIPAIFLQVSDELWNLGERKDATELLHRTVKIAEQPPQHFEASKILAGCARLLLRWGNPSEAAEVARAIESQPQREAMLEELRKESATS
jgi:tetratricopeptide (TPR) repeat protein